MKELLSATSVLLTVGTADNPNVNAWLMLALALLAINLTAWNWEAINRTIERGVIWFWALSVKDMILKEPGISTRDVADIIRDYAGQERDSR